jgi:hypothetical protein
MQREGNISRHVETIKIRSNLKAYYLTQLNPKVKPNLINNLNKLKLTQTDTNLRKLFKLSCVTTHVWMAMLGIISRNENRFRITATRPSPHWSKQEPLRLLPVLHVITRRIEVDATRHLSRMIRINTLRASFHNKISLTFTELTRYTARSLVAQVYTRVNAQ